MNSFFKKRMKEEDLRDYLLSKNESKIQRIRKFLIKKFLLIDNSKNPKIYFYQILKDQNNKQTSFDIAFKKLLESIPNEEEDIINSFEYHFDFEIINLLQTTQETMVQHAENYLLYRFSEFMKFKSFQKIVPDDKERLAALSLAFTKFINQIRPNGFEQRSTLKTFFNGFFKAECIDIIRKEDTENVKNDPLMILDKDEDWLKKLSNFKTVENSFLKYDIEFLQDVLKLFKIENQRCHDLIVKIHLNEFSMEALAEQTGRTGSQIRGDRFRCIEKLKEFWKKNEIL